jgi:DNA adenine methylase
MVAKIQPEQLAFDFFAAGPLPPPAEVKPVLKFVGGKAWLVPLLARNIWLRLARTGGRYIEPFLGGGALALHLGLPDMILGDSLPPLMEMYAAIKDKPAEVAWALSAYASGGVDKESYYKVRDLEPDTAVARAARMIYMNKLGFNGVIRYNRQGKFNVPYGDAAYRSSSVNRRGRDAVESLFPSKGKIEAVAKSLRGAELHLADFGQLCQWAGDGDVVFCDPPYDGTFDGYTGTGFTAADQERLATELGDAARAGAVVYACNADTDRVRALYSGWSFVAVAEKRSVNRDGGGRGRVPCVVVTNWPEGIGTF